MGPVDVAVLELDEAAAAVGDRDLLALRVAEPGVGCAHLHVAGTDAAPQEVGASVRVPVGASGAVILNLAAAGGVVLTGDAGADLGADLRIGLQRIADRTAGCTLRAAVALRQGERVSDLWPCLGHLELPVRPVVDAGVAEAGGDLHTLLLGLLEERLGGQAGHDLQADTGRAVLPRVARGAVTGGDVHGHILQQANPQLRVVLVPVLGAEWAPHLLRVVAATVLRGVGDALRHARGGGVQVAGEGADELPHLREALREVHRRGAAHGQADDRAVLGASPALAQDSRELVDEEALPLVVLAVIRLLPVGVEGGLAADREDDVDVLVRVEVRDVRGQGPARLVLTGAQTIESPDGRELLVRLGVPVAGQQDLNLHRLVWHGGRVDVDVRPAVGDPLDLVHGHALRQAREVLLGHAHRLPVRDLVGFKVASAGARAICAGQATAGVLRVGSWHQGQGKSRSQRQGERRLSHAGRAGEFRSNAHVCTSLCPCERQ